MIFYNLDQGKVVKVIKDGKGFVRYNPPSSADQNGTLTYLSDKKNFKSMLVPKYIIELELND